MTIDAIAAQGVMRARQFERVVHDRGPWSVHVGGTSFPARKVVGDDHVTFFCLLRVPARGLVELHCGDDAVAIRLIDEPCGDAQIAWEFAVPSVPVA